MSAIDEARRQKLLETLDEADSDPQTTGVFLAPAVATQEATDASSVVTQETTLEDSLRNDLATLLPPLSPSVSPSGNGCRGDSSWLPRRPVNETAVAIRKARGLANGWRYLLAPRRGGLAREAVLCSGELPVGTVLARMLPTCRKRLEQHAAAEAASR